MSINKEREMAFVIMQIGNDELDRVYREAIRSAIEQCDLEARRVDKHTKGGLLKSEIIDFIRKARIVVADLTNGRPNCYLEVGFCMGAAGHEHLILTAREDHNSSHPSFSSSGPRIHFDLQGYDILFWNPDDLPGFRASLIRKIQQRRTLPKTPHEPGTAAPRPSARWLGRTIAAARQGATRSELGPFMEVQSWLIGSERLWNQRDLLKAAREAQVRQSGWPIGIVLDSGDTGSPKPSQEGIVARISDREWQRSFDQWALHEAGDYYHLGTLTESLNSDAGGVCFDVRIRRTAEAILYCRRLYKALGVNGNQPIGISIGHHGLYEKQLKSSDPGRIVTVARRSSVDHVEERLMTSLDDLGGASLVDQVEALLTPLFMVFDFAQFDREIYNDIIAKFESSPSVW